MENDNFIEIDGIKCYSQKNAFAYSNYPDGGFDFMDNKSDLSFWVKSRNRIFKALIYKNIFKVGEVEILEIGCGTGGFISKISSDDRFKITGSEIYHKGLVYAKTRQPKINFIQYDVVEKALDIDFDMILAFDVLEHIDDDCIAIKNIKNMLKHDGKVIISVPQHRFLWGKLDDLVMHKRRYSKSELVRKIQDNGLRVNYATSFVFILFPLMFLSRMFDRGSASSVAQHEKELEARVVFNPIINELFNLFMRIDEFFIKLGISLPFGGTLIVVASKQ
jgi:2-polyprenyl-3-methyl-5-hydroxy-6-metoxy-1,4-benzoquinol methylase